MKKTMRRVLSVLAWGTVLLVVSCQKDTMPAESSFAPKVSTENVSDVKRASAVLSGAITPAPGQIFEEYGLMVSRNPVFDYTHNDAIFKNQTHVTYAGLLPGSTYYFAPYAKNGMTVVVGNVLSFTTAFTSSPQLSAPEVTRQTYTGGAVKTRVGDTGSPTTNIMLSGYIYMESAQDASPADMVLGNEKALEQRGLTLHTVRFEGTPTEGDDIEIDIPNLTPGKRYAVRAYAVADGVGYSDIAYIQTEQTTLPTMSVVEVGPTGSLNAHLISRGNQDIVEMGFCYAEGAGLTPTIEAGQGIKIVAEPDAENNIISSLVMGYELPYSIRAYAIDTQGGVGYGEVVEATNHMDLSSYVQWAELMDEYYDISMIDSLMQTTDDWLHGLDAQISGLQQNLVNLRSQVESGYVSQSEYLSMYQQLQADISDLQSKQQGLLTDLANVTADLQDAATRLSHNAETQQQQIDSLNSVIDGLKTTLAQQNTSLVKLIEVRPLPVQFQQADTANVVSSSFTVSCAVDYAAYEQSYTAAYGAAPDGTADYYTRLYPVTLTGFLVRRPELGSDPTMMACFEDPATHTFTTTVSNLTPNRLYNVQPFAVNSYGVALGTAVEVTTKGPEIVEPQVDENPFPGVVTVKRRTSNQKTTGR